MPLYVKNILVWLFNLNNTNKKLFNNNQIY